MDSQADRSIPVRAYRADDRPEVVRLLRCMYHDMHEVYGGLPPSVDLVWENRVMAALDRRLGRDVAVFVVDGDQGRLAALAGGRISEGLPSPRRRHLTEGYIDWVVTDPGYRSRGYASAATSRLLEWFRETDALSVALNASPAAESLYLRLGFSTDGPRAMSIRLDEGSSG